MANVLIITEMREESARLSTMIEDMTEEFNISVSQSLSDAVSSIPQKQADIVIMEMKEVLHHNANLIAHIQEIPTNPEIILITDDIGSEDVRMAMKTGIWDLIHKPLSLKTLNLSLSRAIKYRNSKKVLEKSIVLERKDIIGHSHGIKHCLQLVAQAATSNANVLIVGETGTGKELFARAIHENSGRFDKNFVVIDCTVLPETLVESVIFGHRKGAFTGADSSSMGLITQADKGTLFLDEVGELPLAIQKSFLRVLQEHRLRPVGSNKEEESNFRLIAATNRNLENMVHDHQFRKDLFYRLNSFIIELPPLRSRRDDIRPLVLHFISKFSAQYQMEMKGISPAFWEILEQYSWPGNVRELYHTIEQSYSFAVHDTLLYPHHIPSHIRSKVFHHQHSPKSSQISKPSHFQESEVSFPTLQEVREGAIARTEKDYLKSLMNLTSWNIPRACLLSGLSRSRLYELLKHYGISRTTE